jgi:hypothetical protein
VANYWLEKGEEAFQEYMRAYHDEVHENGSVPEKYQLPEWWEVDDLDHMNTVEFVESNFLHVEDVKTGETVAEIELTEDKLGNVRDSASKAHDEGLTYPNGDKYIVYGQSYEKGTFDFEILATDEPFDISKVKFNVAVWSTLIIVDTVEYDGELLNGEGSDTIGKSYSIWIDN